MDCFRIKYDFTGVYQCVNSSMTGTFHFFADFPDCLPVFTINHIAFFLYFVTDSVKCLALWLFKTDMSSRFVLTYFNSKCKTKEYDYTLTKGIYLLVNESIYL